MRTIYLFKTGTVYFIENIDSEDRELQGRCEVLGANKQKIVRYPGDNITRKQAEELSKDKTITLKGYP